MFNALQPSVIKYTSKANENKRIVKNNGGNGVIRQILFKEELDLTIVSQHRVQKPYGLQGGSEGSTGEQTIIRQNGEIVKLSGIDSCRVFAGDRFIIKTPGGGGYGKKVGIAAKC